MATTKVQSELIVDDVALAGNPTTSTQSAGNNTTRIATTAFVTTAVNNLIDSAPGTMDTLNEIAAALNDDPSFTTTVNNAIATKLPLAGGTLTGDLTIPDKIIHAGDTDTYLQFNAANTFRIVAGDDERFRVATSEVVVNETGLDVDFRVESDGNTNMLTVDAGNNRVGIATASPSTPLHVIYVGNPNGGNRNTVEDVLTLEATGYYPYTGYGVGINFQGEDYGNTAIRDYGKIQAVMEGNADQNASGDPSFTSQLGFWTNSGGASNTVSTQKMTIKADGKVGIGTTSPASLLHINGSGDAIRVESTNAGAGGAQVDLLHFTASPADDDVHGVINFGGYYSGTTSAYGSSIQSTWTDVSAREAKLEFYTRDDSDWAARMTIDHDGNVGIGETAPTNLLHVKVSDVGINPHSSAQLVLERSGTNYLQFLTAADGTSGILFGDTNDYDTGKIVYDHNIPAMQFVTENQERMRIDSTGRVGINRTPAITNAKLEVGGADNVPLINVEASGATAGVGIGSSRMKFYYGTAEKASIDSSGNLRTARQVIQENSDGTPRFINIPFSSAGSGFAFNWDDLANHSAVGDQSSETNAFMFEVNVTSYLFRHVKALIIVDTNADNSISVVTLSNSTLTCSASIPTGSEQITITIGGLWSNAVNYMGRITTF
jgi:hypothetical protein